MTTDDARLDALEQFASIHDAIGVVSAVCDYARKNDDRGFNAPDAWLGHALAGMPLGVWTSDTALAAWDMLRKYRGQLAAAGIEWDQLPRPEGADELEAERLEEARERREEAHQQAAERREEARQRAREKARQWRDERYRKSRSYVRCDGDGDEVVLSFAYDPDLVAACRKIEGRRYDGTTKTNKYPFTSLPDVIKFADEHEIDVTTDVRALAAIAADRAAELAAELAARPEIRFEVSGRDQRVSPDGEPVHETIAIDAPYDPALTAALKDLNGGNATWDSTDGLHRLPFRCVTGLPEIAERFSLRISDEARAHIEAVSAEQTQTRADADAFEADPVPVPGLAPGLALKPQQYPVVRFALKHRRVLIGDDMGWGKTLSSLAAAAADGAYPAVVVCRPSLTLNWSAEIRRFFPKLKIYEASGTTSQAVPPGTDVIVIGSAALAAKPRKTENGRKEFGWVEELAKVGPKALIIDEGQDTKERTANRSQACEQLAANVIARDGLVLDLTGTAILNRPRELCQQLTILGRLDEFGGEKKFLWRYCLSEMTQHGANYNGAQNLIELHDRLRSWGIMVRRSDDAALGLPPCRQHVLVVAQADLDPDVMARYREAEADLLEFLAEQARQAAARLGKDPNSAAVEATMLAASAEHLVAINTLRQLAGQAKREYVTRWIRSHVNAGEKVMVAAHHRPEVDAYAAEFGGLKLQGGQSVTEKEKAKKAFQDKPAADAPVISVAIGAGGVGHTLTAARIGIQAEQAWTPGETQQMKKRLHRIGQDRAVDYYVTVAEGTIDEQLWSVVTSKQATLDAVLDGRSDSGAAADESSVAAELTWRLTQQGLGNPTPDSPISDGVADAVGASERSEISARHEEVPTAERARSGAAVARGLATDEDHDGEASAEPREPPSDDRGQQPDRGSGEPGVRQSTNSEGGAAPGFYGSWPMTAEEGRMADALSRGEQVPGGPGACTCGHLTLWHGEHDRYRGMPRRQCDCRAFQMPREGDAEHGQSKVTEPGTGTTTVALERQGTAEAERPARPAPFPGDSTDLSTVMVPEAVWHWEAAMISAEVLGKALRLDADESTRRELVYTLLNAPVRGWLPVARRRHSLAVQWDATRVTAPPVPDRSVRVTLILPEFRVVLGLRSAPGEQFQYRDVAAAEALTVLLTPESAFPHQVEPSETSRVQTAQESAAPSTAQSSKAHATGVCAVCGTPMTIIEPGQTIHPLRDGDSASEAVSQPALQEEDQAADNGEDQSAIEPGTDTASDVGVVAAPAQEEEDEEDEVEARISPEMLREFAHRYLNQGLLPVPAWGARPDGECCCSRGAECDRPGKHPRAVRAGPRPGDFSWKPLTCRTYEQVEERFADDSEYAAGNLMVAIPAGMMAIDRDDDEGGRAAAEALAEELGSLPSTLSHQTPHGEHLVFRTPDGWKGRAWVGKAPGNPVPAGIDLRMPGQILMAAPSIVPGQGGPASYGPVSDERVASLPATYVTAWTPPQPQSRASAPLRPVPVPAASADRASKYVSDSMTRIANDLASRDPGGRNPAAYAAGLKAGSLLGAARTTPGAEHAAWTDEQAEQALLDAARRNGYVDKDGEGEALRAIRSGLRNGLKAPRTLPDFTTHRTLQAPASRSRSATRSAPQLLDSRARERSAAGPARSTGRWQDVVPDTVRREVEAADNAALARRHGAITAHQQALERHDRAATAETAAEVQRTAAQAQAAHEAYTQDGRHVVGRHDAAMLRWAASITAQRERAASKPGDRAQEVARSRADAAADRASEAYRSGDLDEARRLTEEAAASDSSRSGLWQQYRDQIDARRVILASRQAYHDGGGDWRSAEHVLEETRRIDPRIRGRAIWNQDLPSPSASHDRQTAARAADANARTREGRRQLPQRQHGTNPGGSRVVQRQRSHDARRVEQEPSARTPAADRVRAQEDRQADGPAVEDPEEGRSRETSIDPSRWPAPNPRSVTRSVPASQGEHHVTRPENIGANERRVSTEKAPEADTSSWPARDPHARSQPARSVEEAEHHEVAGDSAVAPPPARRDEVGSRGADWRNAFLSAERESWQSQPIKTYDSSVFRAPQTTSPEEEIEADP